MVSSSARDEAEGSELQPNALTFLMLSRQKLAKPPGLISTCNPPASASPQSWAPWLLLLGEEEPTLARTSV